MTRPLVVALALALAAGCGRDVPLGDVTPDGAPLPPDADHGTFTSGPYMLSVQPGPIASCENSLVGHEPDFESITPGSLNVTDGVVMFTMPDSTTLTITGTQVQMAIGQSSIDLNPGMPPQPPQLWDGSVGGMFGTGPDSTTRTATDYAVDITTAHASLIQAQIGILFVDLASGGDCTLVFGVAFTAS
jgi:hypothetical protein